MVFIGKNLNRDELTQLFQLCKAEDKLRFDIGTKIVARTGQKTFEAGTVIRHWDEGNCYRIRLDRKDKKGEEIEVWAPADLDVFIKQA